MALNTIHTNKEDRIPAQNLTQNNYFRCELVENKTSERVQTSLGLALPSVKLTLKVNGHCSVFEKDKVKVFNEIYIVAKIASNYTNKEQFRKRADYNDFNGESYLFLE